VQGAGDPALAFKPDRGMVTIETLTLNQRDETCQRLVTQMVVLRRPG
jgi:hypothetical protein